MGLNGSFGFGSESLNDTSFWKVTGFWKVTEVYWFVMYSFDPHIYSTPLSPFFYHKRNNHQGSKNYTLETFLEMREDNKSCETKEKYKLIFDIINASFDIKSVENLSLHLKLIDLQKST